MKDWPDDDDDSRKYSNPPHQPVIPAINTRHGVGHITLGNTSPRDTCAHTCYILKQSVNGLGARTVDCFDLIVPDTPYH